MRKTWLGPTGLGGYCFRAPIFICASCCGRCRSQVKHDEKAASHTPDAAGLVAVGSRGCQERRLEVKVRSKSLGPNFECISTNPYRFPDSFGPGKARDRLPSSVCHVHVGHLVPCNRPDKATARHRRKRIGKSGDREMGSRREASFRRTRFS